MKKYYIGYNLDEKIVKKSSSGGIFTVISDFILDKYNGSVYGCVLDSQLKAVHVRADSSEGRDRMLGSKYIQSDIRDTFKNVAQDLKADRYVLFSGTPCQISAMISYLNAKNISSDRLLTVEVTCHGVGSGKYFNDYINYLGKKYKGRPISCSFRAKEKPWKIQQMKVEFDNNKKYVSSSINGDYFYSVYLKNYILRPSCYKCKFASETRYADITIADAWGHKSNNNITKSLIIVNTEKGSHIIDQTADKMNIVEVERSGFNQSTLTKSTSLPKNREAFWSIYLKDGFVAVLKYAGCINFKANIKRTASDVVYKLNLDSFIKKLKKKIK